MVFYFFSLKSDNLRGSHVAAYDASSLMDNSTNITATTVINSNSQDDSTQLALGVGFTLGSLLLLWAQIRYCGSNSSSSYSPGPEFSSRPIRAMFHGHELSHFG